MLVLLDNVSADTDNVIKDSEGSHKIAIVRAESYGGGTVELQIREKNSETYFPTSEGWHTLENGTFIEDAEVGVEYIPYGCEIRAKLSGSTGANNVRVVLL